ncbi:tetratricopeptide repeat protein [Trichocoleus sp. FACHB-591]|uniref:O-linked N-acetylglucosamine transferase family protein n=1 Tax=Trichocoleus sp. FACHB-591 TaxID=2692872 RepID=UPI001684F21C|nr:tetratricopeptide repeat protein [Trichocoleus sp. FACHB-591]MBD2097883.1 tetratricopeptide repeat protein [Trichocoleus sp. FACHB-591]
MGNWQILYQEATALQKQNSLTAAEQKYQQALQLEPKQAEIWSDLGHLYYQMGRHQEAFSTLSQALEISRFTALHHYRLGMVFEQLQQTESAIQAYENTIKLDANLVEAYLALGRIFVTQSQFDAAISNYLIAHDRNPRDVKILSDLGQAYELQANESELRSDFYLGFSYYRQGNYAAAIAPYEKFLASLTPAIASEAIERVYRYLGDSLQRLNHSQRAAEIYQAAVKQYSQKPDFHINLIAALRNSGQTRSAIAAAATAAQLFPDMVLFERDRHLVLPILYESSTEISTYRQQFNQGLAQLIQYVQSRADVNSAESRAVFLRGLGSQTNFYLHYQGQNDLEQQVQFAQLLHQLMAVQYPELMQPLATKKPSVRQKIRVGYASACMWKQTVGVLFLGWLRHSDRQNFEIYSYHLHPHSDEHTEKFRASSDVFRHLPVKEAIELDYIQAVGEQIRKDELDILVFLDVGMHPYMSLFSSLRLAPVQCVTWGHPVTTGSPTIDYFLSSELMEPEDGDKHYSEELVRLPNISIAYSPPDLSEATKTRADFGLREDAVLYLSCQTLFKYLPQYDYIFAAIAQQVPQAQFVFISHKSAAITEKFSQRLERAFAQYGLKSPDYCAILPRQGHNSYLSLNRIADVFLDTFSWSGGNTALEAIACQLPVVTCLGKMMRSRHSYAVLKQLGVTEAIAANETEYIQIAARLGLDPKWRHQVSQKIKAARSRLYDDITCVKALENFYQQVVHQQASLASNSR